MLAGRMGADELLDALAGFAGERSLPVWQAIAVALRGVGRMTPDAHLEAFAARVRSLTGPALADYLAAREPQAVAVLDVVAQLEKRAAANPQKLNWRTSIVDLLKLLDIDSSFAARKELATELQCPADLMADSAKMNMWLHKTVLARIAANGGNVPKELLD